MKFTVNVTVESGFKSNIISGVVQSKEEVHYSFIRIYYVSNVEHTRTVSIIFNERTYLEYRDINKYVTSFHS